MNKLKISTGLAAIVLLSSLFAGWGTLLTVCVLMLLFCEMNDNIKRVMTTVITFYVGLTIVQLAWDLIVDGVNLVTNSIDSIVNIINNYLNEPINLYKLKQYLLSPLSGVVNLGNNIIYYLLAFTKFAFIVAILCNKPMKDNFVVRKINEYINKVVNYINSFEMPLNMNQQTVNVQNQYNNVGIAQQMPNQQKTQNQNISQ